jgi:hypothetical protein
MVGWGETMMLCAGPLEDREVDAEYRRDGIEYLEEIPVDNHHDVFDQRQVHVGALRGGAVSAEEGQVDADGFEQLLDDLQDVQQEGQERIRIGHAGVSVAAGTAWLRYRLVAGAEFEEGQVEADDVCEALNEAEDL